MSDHDQAIQDAYDAGLTGDDSDPAPAASETPSTDPTKVAQGAGEPASEVTQHAEDPFAGLNPQVRELLGSIPRLEQSLQAANRIVGMVPAMQSRIDKLTAQLQAPSPSATAPKRFEAIDRVRTDLPEIADALDEIVNALPKETPTPEPVPARQDPASDPQVEVLEDVRPGWGATLNSDDYQLWLRTQPPEYRETVQRTQKASVILKSLQHFDAFVAQTQSTRQAVDTRTARMASTVSPRGDGRRQNAPADDDLQAIFEAALTDG